MVHLVHGFGSIPVHDMSRSYGFRSSGLRFTLNVKHNEFDAFQRYSYFCSYLYSCVSALMVSCLPLDGLLVFGLIRRFLRFTNDFIVRSDIYDSADTCLGAVKKITS